MNTRLALTLGALTLAYAVWLWLTYVVVYQRGREETIARLLTNGHRARARLLREEGIA